MAASSNDESKIIFSNKENERENIPLTTKKLILDEIDNGSKYDYIVEKFNLKHKSNVSSIKKDRQKILACFYSSNSPLQKTAKRAKYEVIDRGLMNFVTNCLNQGKSVNDKQILEKACKIATENNILDFKGSNGYLCSFKKRNNIVFTNICGEAGAALPLDTLSYWVDLKLRDYIHLVDPDNIYNADELGLFWRMLPSKTYAKKNSVCTLGEQSKERVTILLAANMSGRDKLPLCVIGKSEHRQHVDAIRQLNLKYYANSSAWMTSEIYTHFLQQLNTKLAKSCRSILLFVDNCTAHPHNLHFSNIQVHFLPPNTKSILQPFDAGLTKMFKSYFRLKQTRKIIALACTNQSLKPKTTSFYEAIEIASSSWNEIKREIIASCFRHCGFYKAKCFVESGPEIDIDSEFDLIERQFVELNGEFSKNLFGDVSFIEFVQFDDHLQTCAQLDESGTMPIEPVMEVEEDEEEVEEELVTVTDKPHEIYEYLQKIKLYGTKTRNKIQILDLVTQLENLLFETNEHLVHTNDTSEQAQ